MNKSSETPEALFVRLLGVDATSASRLVAGGLTTLEEIAYVPIEELLAIEGCREEQIQAWRRQARHYLLMQVSEGPDEADPVSEPKPRKPSPIAGSSGAGIERDDDA